MSISENFETGVDGDFVTFANSPFTGIDWEVEGSGYSDWGAIFTSEQAHSGVLSITGGPGPEGGNGAYSELQFPYVDENVLAEDEVLTFWHKHVTGSEGESANPEFYSMWSAPVGTSRIGDWTRAFSIYWYGSDQIEVWMNSIYTFDVPVATWLHYEVRYTHATETYSVTVSDGESTVYGTCSETATQLGLASGLGFAFHAIYPQRNTYTGQDWFDDINYAAPPPPPATPTGLVLTTTNLSQISVTWDAVEGVTGYEVRIGAGEPVSAPTNSHTFTDLTPGTDYTITVRSVGAGGTSEWSLPLAAQTQPLPRPHYHRSIRDGLGNLRTNSTISLCEPGTDTPYPGSVYSGPTGEGVRGTTWVATDGVVDFYLDAPAVVDILVTLASGGEPKRFLSQWVGDPGHPA